MGSQVRLGIFVPASRLIEIGADAPGTLFLSVSCVHLLRVIHVAELEHQ